MRRLQGRRIVSPTDMPANPPSVAAKRILILAGMGVLWLSAILVRLVYLQIFDYSDYMKLASRQSQRTIEVSPRRGVIYDRNGHELAMSVNVDSIFAVPSEVPDQANTAALLGRILRTDPHEIQARLQSSHAFAWIARKVDPEVSDRIRDLNLKGVYFQKESKRFYPKRELAAQVLGYVGLDDEGLGGLERSYEPRLRGESGKMLISMDARRHWFGRIEHEPAPGQNVVLTLDQNIQFIAERELDAAMQRTHAAAGTVVVMNPHTGEVLALASRPTFNPNTFHVTDPQLLKNRAVSDIYEPGSTFKVVTLAAALDEKLTRPDELIDCQNGAIYIGGVRIRDHKAYGTLSVAQVLANSSDVGTIKLGLRLGEDRFDHYIRAFGFGSQTGIELPAETRGLAKPVSRWSRVSIGAISMGQEIGVSPIQVAGMINTIANDGVYVPPRIIAGTTDPKAPLTNVVYHPAGSHRVISPLTASQMKNMLEGVVLRGTGKRAILEGYTAAGKTGTAQKADPASGGYSKTKLVASFAGFAPINDPAVSVVVILDSPQGPHEGGQVAAPVFRAVAQQTLAYLNVPQDIAPNSPMRQYLRAAANAKDEDVAEGAPEHAGADLDLAAAEAPAAPASPAAHLTLTSLRADANALAAKASAMRGSDRAPFAHHDAALTSASLASLVSTGEPPMPRTTGTAVLNLNGGVTVPDLIGKPLRAALEAAQQSGLDIDAIGSGVAREQSPAAGTRIPMGSRVAVRFSR
jgi:cell division protein FtsI/penicillin-binding protein 2